MFLRYRDQQWLQRLDFPDDPLRHHADLRGVGGQDIHEDQGLGTAEGMVRHDDRTVRCGVFQVLLSPHRTGQFEVQDTLADELARIVLEMCFQEIVDFPDVEQSLKVPYRPSGHERGNFREMAFQQITDIYPGEA